MEETSIELCVLLALLIIGHCGLTKGEVIISPFGTALVCDGDQLELTCSFNGRVLEWSVNLMPEDNSFESVVDFISPTFPPHAIRYNTIMFTFSRISVPNSQPLTSRLVISQVNSSINGTVVNCADRETRISSSTTINVITDQMIADSPELNLEPRINLASISEEYEIDSITVVLELTPRNSIYSYRINVVPSPLGVLSSEMVRVQLTVSYDVLYNVSIVSSLCDQTGSIIASASTALHYASINCESPNTRLDDAIEVIGYLRKTQVVERGSNISFSCPPGLILTGPNSSTCMGNGAWEPDLMEVRCKVNCGQPPSPPTNARIVPYFSTLEEAAVMYVCWSIYQEDNTSQCGEINTTAVCNMNGNWEPIFQDKCFVFSGYLRNKVKMERYVAVASSVTVFTVASTLFFIIGFLCGHFCQKKRKSAIETVPPAGSEQTQLPYYDDVVLQQPEQELELNENVAYGPI